MALMSESENSLHKIKAEKLSGINQFRTFACSDCTSSHSKTQAVDDLNVFHVLAPTIEDTEHGVRLCAQDACLFSGQESSTSLWIRLQERQ